MREVVSHAGNLPPGDVRLRGEQAIGQSLDGLTNFQETDAHGVEDQPIEQLAPRYMGTDCVDRREDVWRRSRSR